MINTLYVKYMHWLFFAPENEQCKNNLYDDITKFVFNIMQNKTAATDYVNNY